MFESTNNQQSKAEAATGVAMDRIRPTKSKLPHILVGVSFAVVVGIIFFQYSPSSVVRMQRQHLSIGTVKQGVFEDFIPVRARVTPKRTVYLDAIEGGRIEARLVDDGSDVEKGELLARLSNTALQLDVTRNEAIATEQLNNIRTIELQLAQNRLQHKRNLVDINYQIQKLSRQLSRLKKLKDNASQSDVEDVKDELNYFQNLRKVTLESQSTDAKMQTTQLAFLKKSGAQLEANLVLAKQNLASLNVTAPVAGKLSGFDIEIGQSIKPGGRLGQIDDTRAFKFKAHIDEYYLNRVELGQTASADEDKMSGLGNVILSKIYPKVENGQFQVDFRIETLSSVKLRRGQNMQLKLSLSDPVQTMLIPSGGFYQDTGGKWVFVVDQDGASAERRALRLGRRNSQFIEVLAGLEVGEKVVTSSYSGFETVDRLELSGR